LLIFDADFSQKNERISTEISTTIAVNLLKNVSKLRGNSREHNLK